MIIYIYSNETGLQVDSIVGANNAECEALADAAYGSNDYHWSYCDQPISNALANQYELTADDVAEIVREVAL